MSGRHGSDDRAEVLAMSRGYVLSRAIHVAAELGVADHLGDDALPVAELARRTGAHAPHLERLLRFLAGHGIFDERQPGSFAGTARSRVLREDAPGSLRPGLRMVNTDWWRAVGDLGHAVRTGETGFARRHDEPFFAWLKDHAEDQARFDAGMASNSRNSDEAIAAALDLAGVQLFVDVGGGRGGLVRAVLQRHPGVRGLLFDQPQVIDRNVLAAEEALAGRWSTASGDFFQSVPGGAQAYLIKGVIHDFEDDPCVALLGACRRAMSAGSRLLVMERLTAPDNEPHEAKTIDLIMMSLLGGRERTMRELEGLLARAGLSLAREIPTASEFTIAEATPI
jgi:hypothetical protein